MAGLVDYGVESDRESCDSPNHETSFGNNRKKPDAKPLPDDGYARTKGSSSSKESKSLKSGYSKEVHKSSSSGSKNNDRHHKHRKRSRSRDRSSSHSNKRSRSRDRKDRHRGERKKKHRSKSRSRSRSSSSNRRERKSSRRTRSQERREKKAATIARMGLDVTNVAASLVIPSAEIKSPGSNISSIKQNPNFSSSVASPASSSSVMSAAVQAAAQQVLQNRVAEAQQVTGVTLPSFYNPAAVNPMKYAQQIQKRKLLWANKEKTEPPTTAKLWEATAFTQDQDGKMSAKFKRLMGIKNETSEGGAGPSKAVEDRQPESSVDVLKKQQELFASLDQQYQVARATTHTQRGLGLGFGSSNSSYPR